MAHPDDLPLRLEIPLYGLPRGTDPAALALKAAGVAASLEELGSFDQREPEPAHAFRPTGENDR
ncbi:MAG: hypothetical protein MUD16_02360 [Desulfobacterales bacterium]|jgi:hypothetical protein|nr:hypothetical protein [Desulfobacterales bacterium]